MCKPSQSSTCSAPDESTVSRLIKKGKRPDTIHEVGDGKFYAEVPLPTDVNPKYKINETIIPLMGQCWDKEPDIRPAFEGMYMYICLM